MDKMNGQSKPVNCNCHSYNADAGSVPNVILEVPEEILRFTDGRQTVCIDACIAETIANLWGLGLPTLNSCCGHNKSRPEIIIPENRDPSEYLVALSEIDPGREWSVSRWERVTYCRGNA